MKTGPAGRSARPARPLDRSVRSALRKSLGQRSAGRIVSLLGAVVAVALLVIAGFAVAIHITGMTSGVSPPPALKTVYVNLTIDYAAATDASWYTTANFSVPATAIVVFTITNHDPGMDPLLLPSDNQVMGTVGNVETVRSGPPGLLHQVSSLPSDEISHTFTIRDAQYNLNVPVPPAANIDTPSVTSFTATFNSVGTYQWGCMCRCGPMTVPGVMYGDLTVD